MLLTVNGALGLLTTVALAAASSPSAEPLVFSPGVGYTAAQTQRWQPIATPATAETTAEQSTEELAAEPAASGILPRLGEYQPPPQSDFAKAQAAPAVRQIEMAVAVAAQVAMVVAGAVSQTRQNRRYRRAQRGQIPAYRPYR